MPPQKLYGCQSGVVILTFYRLGEKEKWENTKIINGNRNIQAKDQFITSIVGNEFTHIMKTAEALQIP